METDLDSRKDAVGVYNKILKSIMEYVERINIELIRVDTPYFGKIVFRTKIRDIQKTFKYILVSLH